MNFGSSSTGMAAISPNRKTETRPAPHRPTASRLIRLSSYRLIVLSVHRLTLHFPLLLHPGADLVIDLSWQAWRTSHRPFTCVFDFCLLSPSVAPSWLPPPPFRRASPPSILQAAFMEVTAPASRSSPLALRIPSPSPAGLYFLPASTLRRSPRSPRSPAGSHIARPLPPLRSTSPPPPRPIPLFGFVTDFFIPAIIRPCPIVYSYSSRTRWPELCPVLAYCTKEKKEKSRKSPGLSFFLPDMPTLSDSGLRSAIPSSPRP